MSVPEPLLRRGGTPVVIGHRGASATSPENTMPAFTAAWDAGAAWIETDVQPTADDQPILLHDDTVDRTTDGTGRVDTFTAASLAALDAGSWFGPSFAGTRVPRLSELLAALSGDRRVLLEVKGPHTAPQARAIVDGIRAAGADRKVLLQSFEVPVLRELRAILPDEPLGLLVESIGDDPVGDCQALGAITYNPYVGSVLELPGLITTLHAAGIATIPWTVDDPDQWARLTELGVDGIITNDPAALLAWQARRAAGDAAS